MTSSLTTEDKRELIYVGERLQEIANEMARLSDEQDLLSALEDPQENEKRRRIYVVEHHKRLLAERAALLATRETLLEAQ